MGGCSCEDDCGFINPRTLVLVGKTGNGKSAMGNSILGMKVLLSKRSSSGVTISSELHATTLENGQMLKVIDTPGIVSHYIVLAYILLCCYCLVYRVCFWTVGTNTSISGLFDPSLDFEFIGKEIVKCINMAQDGVDAFLFVVSALNRFSEEEEAAISSLKTLFGRKVYDYMIVVFTGGDQLEDDDQTMEDFLCDSSEALKETLRLCRNRYVLFDNKTKDQTKRSNQVKELLLLVNMVSTMNGGKPYTNEIFTEMKVKLVLCHLKFASYVISQNFYI
ncbi:putative AIG1-type guanine nucleotide-binding (G) domain-containing protein [Helianthus annuus]|nr:putative AIG1-type guanine nucleotide-binding (G) domain-containing protein [Helianthus annuus]